MKKILIVTLFALTTTLASAQYAAVRVNTLALALGTLQVGADVSLNEKWSVDVSGAWSPLLNHTTLITAGVKRWRFEPNVGWFWSLHSTYSPFHLNKKVGFTLGAGSSIGYSWILSRRWNFSLEGGLGVFYLYDRWLVPDTSPLDDIIIRHRQRIMLFPSKIEASFSYLF